MSKEIKNTLFRFITMRAPELIDVTSKSDSFIFHEQLESSAFSPILKPEMETSKREEEFQKIVRSDKNYTGKQEIKEVVGNNFYRFAIWLIHNRATLTVESVTAKMKGVNFLNEETRNEIWDNVFYQITTYSSGEIREILFSILTGDHFIRNEKATEKTDEAYRKLAQARIIIPNNLFQSDNPIGDDNEKEILHTKSLDRELNTIILKDQLDYLSGIKKDVEKIKKKYEDEQRNSFDKQYKEYLVELKKIESDQPQKEQEYTDPELNITKKFISYDRVEIPEFEPKPIEIVELEDADVAIAKSKRAVDRDGETIVINDTNNYIQELKTEYGYDSFEEITNHIENEISVTAETLFEEATLEETYIDYNGVKIPASNLPAGSVYSISGSQITPTTILFNTDFFDAYVVSASYEIQFQSTGEKISGTVF